MNAVQVLKRNALVYKRTWRGSVVFTFLTPLFFLGAMGIGLGSLIGSDQSSPLGGVKYLDFLGPGLMAAGAMQAASFEASFPIMSKLTWQRNYEAMLATPLRVLDLVIGEVAWLAVRLGMITGAFFVVLTIFDVPRSPFAFLSVLVAVLTGIGFSSWIMAYTTTLKNAGSFNGLFRFVITPLYLFSGTFFPIDRLPDALEKVAYATPLYHGVALGRGLMLDRLQTSDAYGHLLYLVLFAGSGFAAAYVMMRRKLTK